MKKRLYNKERGPRLVTSPAREHLLASYKEMAHPDTLPPPREVRPREATRRYLRKNIFGHDGFSVVWGEEV